VSLCHICLIHPNCHIFASGGIFEFFVLECQVSVKWGQKVIPKLSAKGKNCYIKKNHVLGPQSGLFEVLIQ
jgi:hypothetical protein